MIRWFIAGLTTALVFFGSPLFVALGAIVLAIGWRAWEVLIIGFLIDVLYLPTDGMFGIPFFALFISIILIWGLEPFRNRLMSDAL